MTLSREEQLKILWQMKDSEIDYSDIPATSSEFWQGATVHVPPVTVPVTIRLDPAVLAWYKRQAPREYQTLINAVLEKYTLDREAEIRSTEG